MVVPTHFSSLRKILMVAVIAVFVTSNTNADTDPPAGQDISSLAKEGLSVMNQVRSGDLSLFPELEGIPRTGADFKIDPSFLKEQTPEWLKKQYDVVDKTDKELIYLFASRAMPELELMELMREASGRPNVIVVFRGIYPEENYRQAFMDIHRIIRKAKLDTPPNVLMNPMAFRKFGVTEAPEIVYAKGYNDLIRARGTFSVDWLMREYKTNGRTGDIGSYGTVNVVTEMDLIELMMERGKKAIAKINRQEIVDTYWNNKTFVPIEKAKSNSKRKLDPSVMVFEDIVAPDGTVIAKAGERKNPLFHMPFTYKVLIFDARDEEQVEFVARKLKEYPETQLVQLIASHIYAEDGWKHLRDLDSKFGIPVYILTDEVQQRFGIQRVPSILDADDRYFYIEEFDVRETVKPQEEIAS